MKKRFLTQLAKIAICLLFCLEILSSYSWPVFAINHEISLDGTYFKSLKTDYKFSLSDTKLSCAIPAFCLSSGSFGNGTIDFPETCDSSAPSNGGCLIGETCICVCGGTFCVAAADTDGDGISDPSDNCPTVYNPLQIDSDIDGTGNLCDITPGIPTGTCTDTAFVCCSNITPTAGYNGCNLSLVNETCCCDTCSPVAVCGDGNLDIGEQCDNGIANSNSAACLTTCQNATCGDTFIQTAVEQCEPPNTLTCDANCQNITPPSCGNNIIEAGEQCDDGIANSNSAACLTTCQNATCGDTFIQTAVEQCEPPNTLTCDANCQNITTPSCGNNIIEAGEQCDPPNGIICDASCQNIITLPSCGNGLLEGSEACEVSIPCATPSWTCDLLSCVCLPPLITSVCGNNILEAGEQCDDGNSSNNDGCSNTCTIEILIPAINCSISAITSKPEYANEDFQTCGCAYTNCYIDDDGPDCGGIPVSGPSGEPCCCIGPPNCGNGIVDSGEQCEPPNTATCNLTCQNITPSVCGNNIIEAGEQCDDGNAINTDACLNTCQLATCGDTFIQTTIEQCEPPNTATCSLTCQTITPPVCGNGVINGGEVCDAGVGCPVSTNCAADCKSCCGDGMIQAPNEECDWGTGNIPAQAQQCGAATCHATQCKCVGGLCGNSIVNPGEQCDNGAANSNASACLTSCQNATCGDGFIQTAIEQCDPPDGTTCSATCQNIITCGNGNLDIGEQCEDNNTTDGDGCSSICEIEVCGGI